MRSKFLLSAFILTGLSFNSVAQVLIGIEGGASLVSLYGNSTLKEYTETDLGYNASFAVQIPFSSRIALKTGLGYERKGAAADVQYTDHTGVIMGTGRIREKFNYISLPVLVKYYLTANNRLFANAGPYVSHLLNHESLLKSGDKVINRNNQTSMFKAFDIGFVVGAGAAFPVTDLLNLSVELRNSTGITNISDVPISGKGSIKTNATSLIVGLSYKLGAGVQ